MEKLIQLLVLFIFCQTSVSQESLLVFSQKGNNYIETNGKRKSAKKGDIITNKDKTIIGIVSYIIAVDNNGNSYKISKPGKMEYSKLLAYRQKNYRTEITNRYFKMVWDELTGKPANEKRIGGVFRGEVLMDLPNDSSKVIETNVKFKWNNENNNTAFIFIRNISTGEILKLETDGSRLTLFADNPIFNEGKEYEWAVSTSEFPNLKNIPFYSFLLIDKNTYNQQISSYEEFITEMRQMEMPEWEIDLAICKLYRICK